MSLKIAKAKIEPIRQRTQFTCVAASLSMALGAVGVKCTEDDVLDVLGGRPPHGMTWDDALSVAQYFGAKCIMVCPCTIGELKENTDAGYPVIIGWNPEGRPWGHASVVFDVTDDEVHIADPNIPNPGSTVRVKSYDDFYKCWVEPRGDRYLVRRSALIVRREVDEHGRIASLTATPGIGRLVDNLISKWNSIDD